MTTQQPEALRLADRLDLYATGDAHQQDIEQAAAELRRLHAENASLRDQNTELDEKLAELERINAQLLEALELIPASGSMLGAQAEAKRITAIKAAKGEA
jgi:cell division septum initiation protein DivIVA